MKAIETRYHGPTNFKGSRINARANDVSTIFLSYDSALNSDDMYRFAAYALRDKMGWKGELIGGSIKNSMVWVFMD